MGFPLSVTLCDIYLAKLEIDKIKPRRPLFYNPFLDVVKKRRRKNIPYLLLTSLKNYNPNTNVTIGITPPVLFIREDC